MYNKLRFQVRCDGRAVRQRMHELQAKDRGARAGCLFFFSQPRFTRWTQFNERALLVIRIVLQEQESTSSSTLLHATSSTQLLNKTTAPGKLASCQGHQHNASMTFSQVHLGHGQIGKIIKGNTFLLSVRVTFAT